MEITLHHDRNWKSFKRHFPDPGKKVIFSMVEKLAFSEIFLCVIVLYITK